MAARLEQDQVDLLARIVEAHRSIPREARRGTFLLLQTMGGDSIIHAGLRGTELPAHAPDLRILGRYGLVAIQLSRQSGSTPFDLTPEGIDYYEQWKASQGDAVATVETEVNRYLDAEDFRSRHAGSLARWRAAATAIWSADSERQLTEIGHVCREALQLFADELVTDLKPVGANSDPSRIIDRLRAVLAMCKEKLGEAEAAMLDALLAYWGTVSDLIQRQEHGALREATALTWEDARRVVFHTAIVMFEIDRATVRALGTP